MSWKFEIYRALLLTLGILEVLTNGCYLFRRGGLTLARKQHQELPKGITDHQMKIKVIFMFSFGLSFFVIAFLSYLSHGFLNLPVLIILTLFFLYEISEALYYRYWKTFGAAGVAAVLLGCFLYF